MKKMDEMELHIERTAARWAYRYSEAVLFLWCAGTVLLGLKTGLAWGEIFERIRLPSLLLITQEGVHDAAVLICRAKAGDAAAEGTLWKTIVMVAVIVLLFIWLLGSILELAL